MMRRRITAVLLALCMALCVGIPAAGAITSEDMENAPELIPGEVATVNITTGGQYAYFKIVPEFSCQYTFYSTGSSDTVVYLYNAEGTQTATDDDSGDEYNFRLVVTLTEGETYYLGARIWGTGNTGSYPLYSELHVPGDWTTVTPATCTDPGEETAICTICGEEITREIAPLGHDWTNAVSNNDGTHTYTCGRCEETQTEDCTFETVTEDGVITEVCTECGYTVLSDLIALWDFENEPFDWWFFDGDGDGYSWDWIYGSNWTYHGGSGMIHSASYMNDIGALTPDQYAVSPAFSLAGVEDATLSAWARGQDDTYCNEVFAFYAGTTYNPADWVKVSEDYTATNEYAEYTADLSDFVGEPVVHIAIRHYNVTDMFWLNIDDVSIKGTPVNPCETGNHSMTYVPAKEPTGTEDGNVAYYVCDVCGYYYLDEDGTHPVSAADVILPGGYTVTVDENIAHGTVNTFVSRAKPGDFVPLNVKPDQGAVLEYLAYVDEDGENALVPGPKAKEAVLQGFEPKTERKPDEKPEPNARIELPAGVMKSGSPIGAVGAETEIDANYFTMPDSAVTVVAEFGPKYIVTLDPGEAGGDPIEITSVDDGVWAESLNDAANGQFSPYNIGVDAYTLPDNPFTWTNHTFVNWQLVLGDQAGEANPGDAYYANSYTLIAQWTRDPIADGYYLIGPDWTIDAIDPANVFDVNPNNANEYMLSTALAEGDEIKVVHITDDAIDAWYPDGADNHRIGAVLREDDDRQHGQHGSERDGRDLRLLRGGGRAQSGALTTRSPESIHQRIRRKRLLPPYFHTEQLTAG